MPRKTRRSPSSEIDFDSLLDHTAASDAPYCLLPIKGELAQAAARLAIDLLKAGMLQHLLRPPGMVRDEDVLELIGVTLNEDLRSSQVRGALRRAIAEQSARLGAKPRQGPQLRRLRRNIQLLADRLKLSSADATLLQLAVLVQWVRGLRDLLALWRGDRADCARMLARATRLTPSDVSRALGPNGMLRRAGLLPTMSGPLDDLDDVLTLDGQLAELLCAEDFGPDSLLRAVARPSPAPTLKIDAFPHHRSAIDLAIDYLTVACNEQRPGLNILLYGEPGVGKTELARLLAQASGRASFEVPAEDRDGDPIRRSARLAAFNTCQRLLADDSQRHLVIFDEIEDVFPVSGLLALLFEIGRESNTPKRFVNDLLESSPVPSIWIANSVQQIDPAYLRRFDVVLEVRSLPASERLKLLQRAMAEVALPAGTLQAVARIEALTPAHITSTGRVLSMVRTEHAATNLQRLQLVVQNQLKVTGNRTAWPANDPGSGPFQLHWLNPSQPLRPILDGISRGRRGRICLYGPPGTGKTALAHHLGQLADLPVHAVRASDLLDKYVGQSEQNIAAAFTRARDEGAILLIDEADSLLASRRGANHSWERTQVNEMLTQMEAFDGIFIASTNLAEGLDEASLRRFDFKVRFDPPRPQQRREMVWESYCRMRRQEAQPSGLGADAAHPNRIAANLPQPANDPASPARPGAVAGPSGDEWAAIDRLEGLCPGDIATVRRRCHITAEQPQLRRWIQMLAEELDGRRCGHKQAIGFV